MKKSILFLFVLTASYSFSQVEKEEVTSKGKEVLTKVSENQKRIDKIPNLIEEALQNEDYQKAANLQEELKIRKKIAVAQGNQDYSRVVELEEMLENCDCKPKANQDCVQEKIAENEKEEREKPIEEPFVQKRKFIMNVDFSPAGYLNASETYSYQPYNEVAPYPQSSEMDYFAGNHAVGASLFFGDMNKDIKIGLDLNFMDVTMGINEFRPFNMNATGRFAFVQPGVIMTKYFSNGISGLDIKANVGPVKTFGNEFNDYWGINSSAQVRYWKKKTVIGLKYQFGSGVDYDAHYHHVALVLGLRL